MEKEKSSAEITDIFPKTPGMIVIKGRQNEYVSSPIPPLYAELKKFANVKDTATFRIHSPLDRLSKRIIKRSGDIFLSSLVIVGLLSWLIPIMALLIKLDSKGPVFFLQKRNKRGGKTFTCIKFRTMIENEDADLLQATADDERITKLGRFLRHHYLDELPQFFNVFAGDMSFIGPRPHMVSDNNKYEELIEFYDYRHKVKPGITGLSQAMGYVGETRNIQAMRDRVQLDIFYIRHWSIRLDLKILWHTLRKIAGK
ncbi:MAG TPA: sugar transferase [Chitinophagaceae bacterium]|nr:sugar transferase [Chitinophagaceae bacterium]